MFVEWNGVVVSRGTQITWAIPFFVGCHKRELADNQNIPVHISEAAVHDALLIVENSESGNFPAKPRGIFFIVSVFNAQQDQESVLNGRLDDALDGDGSMADSLNDCSHGFVNLNGETECGAKVTKTHSSEALRLSDFVERVENQFSLGCSQKFLKFRQACFFHLLDALEFLQKLFLGGRSYALHLVQFGCCLSL